MKDPIILVFTRDPLTSFNAKSIHVFEVFKNLARLRPSVLLASDVDTSLYSHPRIMKVPHLRLSSFLRTLGVISFQVALYLQLGYLVRMIKNEHPQKRIIFYVRQSVFFPTPLVFARRHGIPVVLEVNGALELEMRVHPRRNFGLFIWFVHLVLHWYYLLAWHIVAVTPQLKEFLKNAHGLPARKISVIENGTNTQLFRPINVEKARMKLNLPESWKRSSLVGFFGNMEPWQGLETLIHAASLIVRQGNDVRFLFVGDGKLKLRLQELVHRLRLEAFVRFTGRVPYHEVPLYINACNVTVAPFLYLGKGKIAARSPLKVYDSLACGRTVITTRIPSLEFIERENCGFLVEPGNPKKLARVILDFLNLPEDEKVKLALNGRKFVKENHDWSACAQKISVLVDSIHAQVN